MPRADVPGSATIKSSPMPRFRSSRKPTFLWQATLIVLPVLALAVMGSLSLRQDRLLVEQQAKARAQEIAEDLTARIWTALTNLQAAIPPAPPQGFPAGDAVSGWAARLVLAPTGELLEPPPIAELVPYPIDSALLDDSLAGLWETAREAEFREGDPTRATEDWERFLQGDPPPEFTAAARLHLGVVLSRQGRLDSALDELARAATNQPDAVLESGLPLSVVAGLKWLETAARLPQPAASSFPGWLEALCSNAVVRPTLLSSPLLSAAAELEKKSGGRGTRSWRDLWERQEQGRLLAPAVRRELSAGGTTAPSAPSQAQPSELRLFWIDHEGARLVFVGRSESANRRVICELEERIALVLEATLGRTSNLPRYFHVDVEVAGRRFATGLSRRLDVRQSGGRNIVARPVFVAPNGRLLQQDDQGADTAVNRVLPRVRSDLRMMRPDRLLATSRKTVGSTEALRIGVVLVSPDQLFAQQRTRTRWFGGLIAVAAAAALAGLASAWRAFARQLRLNEMKTNFVSSVSHELRAPIASVRLLAESLDRGKVVEPTRQAEYFRLIVQECRRLSGLIENVLDFSRIDPGRKQYEFEPTDLAALVQQPVKLMEPHAAARQVRLEIQLADSPLAPCPSSLDVDGRALQQALVNLLDNAIKHAPANTTVTVGLEGMRNLESGASGGGAVTKSEIRNPKSEIGSEASQPSAVRLWVEDQGDGIPPEEHEKIFEPFYRRGAELRRETQGVGIGLTIVKHIVEAHDGRVTVRSAVGQGSRFTIELPGVPAEVQAHDQDGA